VGDDDAGLRGPAVALDGLLAKARAESQHGESGHRPQTIPAKTVRKVRGLLRASRIELEPRL